VKQDYLFSCSNEIRGERTNMNTGLLLELIARICREISANL
jgi:hypothetical protein